MLITFVNVLIAFLYFVMQPYYNNVKICMISLYTVISRIPLIVYNEGCLYVVTNVPKNIMPPLLGGDIFLLNSGSHLHDYTVSQPRRPLSTFSPPWKSRISFIQVVHEAVFSSAISSFSVYGNN
jgi:hypothetical protein